MSLLQGLREYYSLFGRRGVYLATKARLGQGWMEVAVTAPGIRHPLYVRLRTSDIATLKQVLMFGDYECEFVEPPRVIVDIGANIGLSSVFFANKYPKARIVALEPETSNFRLLEKNSAPYPNIVALQGALWSDNIELRVLDPGLGHYGFQVTAEGAASQAGKPGDGKTLGTTMDELMRRQKLGYIDLLKVDIEGAEKEVFERVGAWIGKVGVIAIELHDRFKPGCSQAFDAATKEFERAFHNGETVFVARPGHVVGRGVGKMGAEQGGGVAPEYSKLKHPYQIVQVEAACSAL